MKPIFRTTLVSILLVCSSYLSATAQKNDISYMPEGRYLVIGTFQIERNAIGFTRYVEKMGKYDVKMAYHPVKKLYYVYIKGYGPGENGAADVKRMRRETEFIDTWYMVVEPYEVPGGQKQVAATPPAEKPTPAKTDSPAETEAEAAPEQTSEVEEQEEASSQWVKASTTTDPATSQEVNAAGVNATGVSGNPITTSSPKLVPITYEEKGKYKLYFNTYYTKNFKEIKGPVEIINPKTLKLLRVAPSLELVRIADPNNGEHSVQLIANIFGYKKVQHDIKLNEPFDEVNEEFFHFKGDTLIADFPLRRYDMGDIATMYNVFFFKDAAIMKPNSKFELNSLLEMLKENDNLKIKIHGHTNGNERGKIITMPEGSEDFFSMRQDLVEDFGSAKELSLRRAEVIKKYLMSFGIDESRMEVIGWGGKKPIYDKMDKLAIKNVRVEIEILEN